MAAQRSIVGQYVIIPETNRNISAFLTFVTQYLHITKEIKTTLMIGTNNRAIINKIFWIPKVPFHSKKKIQCRS